MTAVAAPEPRLRLYGIALCTLAAVLWSTAGLFVRLLPFDTPTLLGWRCVFAAGILAAMSLLRRRPVLSELRAMGWAGIAVVPLSAASIAAYIVSLKLTSVANVLVVYATVPFVAGAIALAWLGERLNARFIVAGSLALVGILVVAGGASRPDDILGDAVAFLMTVCFGLQLVMARRYPTLDMTPINACGAALCALAALRFMSPTLPGPAELGGLALFGFVNTALAYVLYLTGGRYIPSSEAGLIGLLDVVLGPLWVWLAFSERPLETTLLGGGLVLLAVLGYLAFGMRRRIPAAKAPAP